MRCIAEAADKPQEIELGNYDGGCHLYLRQGVRRVLEDDGTSYWQYDEAYMELPEGEAPERDEVAEEFEAWFAYAANWHQARAKTPEQLQADIEYLAAVTGVDLEV